MSQCRGRNKGNGLRCKLIRASGWCHHHVGQSIDPPTWGDLADETQCMGVYRSNGPNRVKGSRCQQMTKNSYCRYHVDSAVRKLPGPRIIPDELRKEVFRLSQGVCYVCVFPIYFESFHCAHIIPDVEGGASTIENLRGACPECNLKCGRQNLDKFKLIRF